MSGWIYPQEQQPKIWERVLVCVRPAAGITPVVTVGALWGGVWRFDSRDVSGEVLAWMPLPDPPEVK